MTSVQKENNIVSKDNMYDRQYISLYIKIHNIQNIIIFRIHPPHVVKMDWNLALHKNESSSLSKEETSTSSSELEWQMQFDFTFNQNNPSCTSSSSSSCLSKNNDSSMQKTKRITLNKNEMETVFNQVETLYAHIDKSF